MTPSRARGTTVVLLVVGAALMLLAGGRVWFSGRTVEPGVPSLPVHVTGRDIAGVVSAVGLLALAAAAVVLLVGVLARRVVGVVVAVAAGIAFGRCLYLLLDWGRATEPYLRDATLRSDASVSATGLARSAWPWVAVTGSVLVLAGALLLVITAGMWPRRERRYDAAPAAPAAVVDPASLPEDERSDAMWKALDRGEDPTAEAPPAGAPVQRADDTAEPPSRS